MSTFDPYHKWLGIPPAEQPPHHYRLLGIAPFEPDLDVIEAAADRQMTYVRQCATGPYMKESQQLLNELSAARVCLLNPARKQAYDRELKARLAPAKSPEPAVSRPRVTRIPAKQQPVDDDGVDDEFAMVVRERPVLERPAGRGNLSLPPRRGRSKKNARPQPYLIWGGAAGLGLLLLWVFIHIITRPGVAANQPAANGVAAGAPAEPAPAAAKRPPAAVSKEPPAVAATEPPPAPAGPPSTAERREIVERVLKLGGEVVVQTGDAAPWTAIKAIDDLPEGGTVKIQNLVLQAIAIGELQSICRLAIDTLYVSQKGVTNNHLAVLGKAKGIRSLNLHSASCTDGGLAHLARCPELQAVSLTQCDFSAAAWKHFGQIPKLTTLTATACDISDAHVESLAGHPGLKYFSIEDGKVTGAGFRTFRGVPQLGGLKLLNCPVDAAGMQAIGEGLPELKAFECRSVTLTDEGLKELRNLKGLLSLRLDTPNITDAALEIAADLESLQTLSLSGAPITGAGFRGQKGKWSKLTHCFFDKCPFSDEGLQHLADAAPQIQHLTLFSTAVTDKGLVHLSKFKSLQTLGLNGSPITDAGLKQLEGLRGLIHLSLSNGRFAPAPLEALRKALPKCGVYLQ